MKRQTYLLWVGLILLGACGKYEDGPGFSLRSRESRLVATWSVREIYVNGAQLQFFAPINITETYRDDGTFTVDEYGVKYQGTWAFRQLDMRIERSAGADSDIIEIDRLTEKEFWYTLSVGPDKHQYRLRKK